MITNFTIPKHIILGYDAIEQSKPYFNSFGKKALIVTDNVMLSLKKVEPLKNMLSSLEIEYCIFSEINGEPTDTMVKEGVKIFLKNNCDFIVALGGGSPIDTMKAIAVMSTSDLPLSSYMGKNIQCEVPKMIAIPTTAGTGSEATKVTIITDTQNNVKMLLKGEVLVPEMAIIDPSLALNTPGNITAATGLDALTHAIEAYTSKNANPLSDMFALSAIEKIFKFLPIAFDKTDDRVARDMMARAAFEAGVAFNNSSVTIVHGMSRPIGAIFHVPHGISNAMLLKECLNFAIEGAIERFATLGKTVGLDTNGLSEKEIALKFLSEVSTLCNYCKIPTLKEYGINEEKFFSSLEKMAEDALISGSPSNTRKVPTKEDIIEIYKKLWK